MDSDNARLKREVEALKAELGHKDQDLARVKLELDETLDLLANRDNDLHLSATIGQKLLDENNDLSQRFDASVRALSTRIEVWRRERERESERESE